jgi:outer membrane usher protein
LLDSSVHLSRPINDSFALVRVPDLKNVDVAFNNQSMGTTNSKGELVVPNLISYLGNNISIDPNNLPVEYQIEQVRQYVAPAFRSGALVRFNVTKLQAFVGKLVLRVDGQEISADYAELTIPVPGKKAISGVVGMGGEFYLENLPIGLVPMQIDWRGRVGVCTISIPASEATQVDLGTVTCELR